MAPPAKSKQIIRYGLIWPDGTNDLNLELAAYRDPKTYPTNNSQEFHFRNAFRIMWPENIFEWNDWMELMCWAWCNYRVISVMGHAGAGKTFGFAHFALLDYLAAPNSTGTFLVTTKFDMLKVRLWGDMMIAIQNARTRDAINATFRTTSSSNEMKFQLRGENADQKFLIKGVALDRGDENAAKLRGYHPPRHRIVGDETQDMSDGLYMAFENGLAVGDFKGALLTNPRLRQSKYGDWSMPKSGWGSITSSTLWWETERGVALHLDGRQSPNVKAKKTVVSYLMSWEYYSSLDLNSVQGWMFGIGFFPPDGMVDKIWPNNTIEKARRSEAFDFNAVPFGTLDPAYGGDDCVFIHGDIGRLRDGKPCACARGSVVITVKVGPEFPERDTLIARECIRLCREHGITPENFIMDVTARGHGVFSIMKNEWVPAFGNAQIQGIEYGGKATERPLSLNDPISADKQVKYFVTELWFRASHLARDGMLCGLGNIDARTRTDLDARIYETRHESNGHRMIAESKDDLKKRIGRSPDFGDAFCQIGELMVRKGLLGGKLGGVKMLSNGWAALRERAKKHQKRFVEEFSHGTTEA